MGDYLTDFKSRSSNVNLKNYVTKEELKNITLCIKNKSSFFKN